MSKILEAGLYLNRSGMKLKDIERSFPILIKILSITSDKDNGDVYAKIYVNKDSFLTVKITGFQIGDSYFKNKDDIDKSTKYDEGEIDQIFEVTNGIEHSINPQAIRSLRIVKGEICAIYEDTAGRRHLINLNNLNNLHILKGEISLLYEDTNGVEHSINLNNIYNLHVLEIENKVEESVERTLTTMNKGNQESMAAVH